MGRKQAPSTKAASTATRLVPSAASRFLRTSSSHRFMPLFDRPVRSITLRSDEDSHRAIHSLLRRARRRYTVPEFTPRSVPSANESSSPFLMGEPLLGTFFID